jgi:26S proteasome regulatory subunit N10
LHLTGHTLYSSSKFLPCSPVIDAKNVLEAIGEKLKKNNVALDVVDFGESDDEKPEKLEALVAAVSSGGNSHIIHVLPGEDFLSNVILR